MSIGGAKFININKPVLYSFRRCPYAIRARLAIKSSGIVVQLREVLLKDKPTEMLNTSPKGTVPVLQLADGQIIDESLDVMLWALEQSDPLNLLKQQTLSQSKVLIDINDQQFKPCLDRYKYAVRFPEDSEQVYRDQCLFFLKQLDDLLAANSFLLGENLSLADMAIFPFIRQFASVDRNWFNSANYINLRDWLQQLLDTDLFKSVMIKYKPWLENERKAIDF